MMTPRYGQGLRVMERRGFAVFDAEGVKAAAGLIETEMFTHAVLDMKLEDGNGLEVVTLIHEKMPDCRIIMLTGFGNIATAVAAVKAGAVDYLPKPADPDAIASALLQQGDAMPPPPEDPMSVRFGGKTFGRVYE